MYDRSSYAHGTFHSNPGRPSIPQLTAEEQNATPRAKEATENEIFSRILASEPSKSYPTDGMVRGSAQTQTTSQSEVMRNLWRCISTSSMRWRITPEIVADYETKCETEQEHGSTHEHSNSRWKRTLSWAVLRSPFHIPELWL